MYHRIQCILHHRRCTVRSVEFALHVEFRGGVGARINASTKSLKLSFGGTDVRENDGAAIGTAKPA